MLLVCGFSFQLYFFLSDNGKYITITNSDAAFSLMLFLILSASRTIWSQQSIECSAWQYRATATQRKNYYWPVFKAQHNSGIQGMLQCKQRHEKVKKLPFMPTVCLQKVSCIETLLIPGVQEFLLPVERRIFIPSGRL